MCQVLRVCQNDVRDWLGMAKSVRKIDADDAGLKWRHVYEALQLDQSTGKCLSVMFWVACSVQLSTYLSTEYYNNLVGFCFRQ